MKRAAAALIVACWFLVDALLIAGSAPRGGPESSALPTLPGAPTSTATVIPTATRSRASGTESASAASGNPSRPTAAPHRLDEITREGIASWVGGHGPDYLALPWGRGVRATICGPGGCWRGISTDAGPDRAMQRRGRVADLSPEVFELVCGVPRSFGLCDVVVTRDGGG